MVGVGIIHPGKLLWGRVHTRVLHFSSPFHGVPLSLPSSYPHLPRLFSQRSNPSEFPLWPVSGNPSTKALTMAFLLQSPPTGPADDTPTEMATGRVTVGMGGFGFRSRHRSKSTLDSYGREGWCDWSYVTDYTFPIPSRPATKPSFAL